MKRYRRGATARVLEKSGPDESLVSRCHRSPSECALFLHRFAEDWRNNARIMKAIQRAAQIIWKSPIQITSWLGVHQVSNILKARTCYVSWISSKIYYLFRVKYTLILPVASFWQAQSIGEVHLWLSLHKHKAIILFNAVPLRRVFSYAVFTSATHTLDERAFTDHSIQRELADHIRITRRSPSISVENIHYWPMYQSLVGLLLAFP